MTYFENTELVAITAPVEGIDLETAKNPDGNYAPTTVEVEYREDKGYDYPAFHLGYSLDETENGEVGALHLKVTVINAPLYLGSDLVVEGIGSFLRDFTNTLEAKQVELIEATEAVLPAQDAESFEDWLTSMFGEVDEEIIKEDLAERDVADLGLDEKTEVK